MGDEDVNITTAYVRILIFIIGSMAHTLTLWGVGSELATVGATFS